MSRVRIEVERLQVTSIPRLTRKNRFEVVATAIRQLREGEFNWDNFAQSLNLAGRVARPQARLYEDEQKVLSYLLGLVAKQIKAGETQQLELLCPSRTGNDTLSSGLVSSLFGMSVRQSPSSRHWVLDITAEPFNITRGRSLLAAREAMGFPTR